MRRYDASPVSGGPHTDFRTDPPPEENGAVVLDFLRYGDLIGYERGEYLFAEGNILNKWFPDSE